MSLSSEAVETLTRLHEMAGRQRKAPKPHPMAVISELTFRWKAFDAPITRFQRGDIVRFKTGLSTMKRREDGVPLLFLRYLDQSDRYDWLLIEDCMKQTTLERVDCLIWAYEPEFVVALTHCSRRLEPWRDSHIADYEAAQADMPDDDGE